MVKLSVCIGSSCHLKGSYNVIQVFQQMIEEHSLHDKAVLKSTFCMRECDKNGVAVSVNEQVYHVPAEEARNFFSSAVIPVIRAEEQKEDDY